MFQRRSAARCGFVTRPAAPMSPKAAGVVSRRSSSNLTIRRAGQIPERTRSLPSPCAAVHTISCVRARNLARSIWRGSELDSNPVHHNPRRFRYSEHMTTTVRHYPRGWATTCARRRRSGAARYPQISSRGANRQPAGTSDRAAGGPRGRPSASRGASRTSRAAST